MCSTEHTKFQLSITSEKIIKIKVETVELCLIEVEILPKNGQLKVENFRPFRIDCFCDQHALLSYFIFAPIGQEDPKVSFS